MQMLRPPKRPLIQIPLETDKSRLPLDIEDYDPPVKLPPPSIWKPVSKKQARTLYDAASPELKRILDEASDEVEKWPAWKRSAPRLNS